MHQSPKTDLKLLGNGNTTREVIYFSLKNHIVLTHDEFLHFVQENTDDFGSKY